MTAAWAVAREGRYPSAAWRLATAAPDLDRGPHADTTRSTPTLTDSNRRPAAKGGRPAPQPQGRRPAGSAGPGGSPRSGRRETDRRRYEQRTFLERYRTAIVAIAVIAVVVGVTAFVFTSAAAPAYACSSVDTVQAAASGELGQVQADMGNAHVGVGDKVTFAVCPPASGHHINKNGFGPLQPKVYGPDDNSQPNGWVHNLEHGGLVLLYSCDKGACDAASTAALAPFASGFPKSAICGLPAGIVGPVIARFEQMPTKYAALIWDRALYLDTLDTQKVYDFFTKYAERLGDTGNFVSPPEPQCAAPTPSASASPSASAVPSASAAASPSPS